MSFCKRAHEGLNCMSGNYLVIIEEISMVQKSTYKSGRNLWIPRASRFWLSKNSWDYWGQMCRIVHVDVIFAWI